MQSLHIGKGEMLNKMLRPTGAPPLPCELATEQTISDTESLSCYESTRESRAVVIESITTATRSASNCQSATYTTTVPFSRSAKHS